MKRPYRAIFAFWLIFWAALFAWAITDADPTLYLIYRGEAESARVALAVDGFGGPEMVIARQMATVVEIAFAGLAMLGAFGTAALWILLEQKAGTDAVVAQHARLRRNQEAVISTLIGVALNGRAS